LVIGHWSLVIGHWSFAAKVVRSNLSMVVEIAFASKLARAAVVR
jgi:hypothetical protein